jgi:uncharacterized membrane protein SpoIIM required for sporulation
LSAAVPELANPVERLSVIVTLGQKSPRSLTRADLRALPTLYRRVSSALAEARARGVPNEQLVRVERLLIAAHGVLYAPTAPRLGTAFADLLIGFPVVVRSSLRSVVVAALLVVVGGLWGYAEVRRDAGNAVALLSPELIDNARAFNGSHGREGDPIYGVFYFTNNAKVALTAYALGATFGLGTVLVLLFNGIVVGGTLAIVLASGGSARFFSFLLPHSGLELLAIFIAAAAGLEMGQAMLRPRWQTRSAALRDAARATLPMALGASVLLVLAGLLEGWVSPKPMPPVIKAGIGVTALASALVYLWRGGRRKAALG